MRQLFCCEVWNNTLPVGRSKKKLLSMEATIKSQRVPFEELAPRFTDYSKVLTLIANAYGKKGNLISADSAFKAAQTWIRKNQRFMGETTLTPGAKQLFVRPNARGQRK
jgi:ADP-ribosylglycohydrolase